MESAMSVINYNPTTKEQIASFTDKIVGEVESGAINALELHVKLTAIESCFKQVKERIKEAVMDEVYEYSEKSIQMYGAKIERSELGVKYDYSKCNHPVYNRLAKESEAIESNMKALQPLLKSLNASMEIVDEETGEMVRIYPAIKSSTTGIKVTLK